MDKGERESWEAESQIERVGPIGGGSNGRKSVRARGGAISQLISGAINDAIEVRDNGKRKRDGWIEHGRIEGQTTIF